MTRVTPAFLVIVFSLISSGERKIYAVMICVTVRVCGSLSLLFAPISLLPIAQFHPNLRDSQKYSLLTSFMQIYGQVLERDLIIPPSTGKAKLNPY